MLNLNEVAELRGWSRENGALRLGSGLTYAEVEHGELRERAAGARRGVAHGRLAADPQPRHDRRQPRHRRRRPATRCRRSLVEGAEVECASVRGTRRVPLGRVRHRREAQRARAGRADHRRLARRRRGAPQTFMKVGPRNAMVIAVVSLAVSAGDELRASFGSASPRPVLVTAPRDEAAIVRRAGRRGRVADRRRARHGALPPPRPARADRARARSGCSHEDLGPRQRRRARGRLLGGRVAALRAAREARLPRLEERVRAGRVRLVLGAARRHARLRVPRARRAGRRPRGDDGRGARRRRRAALGAAGVRRGRRRAVRLLHAGPRRRDGRPAEANAAARPTTRSARRSPATSAAAPATRRSSTRCGWPPAHDADRAPRRSRSARSASSFRAPTRRRR